MNDHGRLIFTPENPAPVFAFQLVGALLILGSIVLGYWTYPMIRDARPDEWIRDSIMVAVMHIIPLIGAVIVLDNVRRARLGVVRFYENGIACDSHAGQNWFSYDEVSVVFNVKKGDTSKAATKGLSSLLLGNWAGIGAAVRESQDEWWIQVRLPNSDNLLFAIPDESIYSELSAAASQSGS